MKTFEAYICILLTTIFLFIIPLALTIKYNNLSKDSQTSYEADRLVWEIETVTYLSNPSDTTSRRYHAINLTTINREFDFRVYTTDGIDVTTEVYESPFTTDGLIALDDEKFAYVYIEYGKEKRWAVIA